MITKVLALVGCMMTASVAVGEGSGIWAEGKVTYKHPNGKLVNRDCEMFVPARGIGEVELKCGDFSVSSAEFSTVRVAGRAVFSIVFRNIEGAPSGSVAKYEGTYLRGTNRALYYGDVFSTNDSAATLTSESDWQHAGGFMFSKSISE